MNKIQLIGRFTKDPEARYTQSSVAYCKFILAVNRKIKKEGQPEADFLNCTAWQQLAELIANRCQKGQQVAVTGRVQTRTWDDEAGKRQYATEVVVEDFYFIGAKMEPRGDAYEQPSQSDQPRDNSGFIPLESTDDELPF
jgi:single-strand DNA-binding protein